MRIKQREIVLLPFPFSNIGNAKVRPAIVVSKNSFNKKSKDCLMVPMTTAKRKHQYSVPINQDDLALGKLLRSSMVRSDKIFTVENTLITMKIGMLKAKPFEKIKNKIITIF